MAEKKTSKKKTTKKVVEESVVQLEQLEVPKEVVVESWDSPEVLDEVASTEGQPVTETLNRYRFLSTISHLNISNVIFDDINVVVYETYTFNKDEAISNFKACIMDNFAQGSTNMYNNFITAVFGSNSNIILEEVGVNNHTTTTITL